MATENPATPDRQFGRRERLCLKRDFDTIFKHRNSAGGERLVVYGMRNQLGYNRLGISIGRRYGNSVERNRFKRICREAFRLSKPQQPAGWDWLILPRLERGKGVPPLRPVLRDYQGELIRQMRRIARRLPSPTENKN